MNNLQTLIQNYLEYCKFQKRLDEKTLKAYRIDLQQFSKNIRVKKITEINSHILENYIASLHLQYQPKTVKRKIATLKAFFHYLEYKDIVSQSPLNRMQIHFREPIKLPKTIPLHTLELFLSTIYDQCEHAPTLYQRRNALRDAAVAELLFSSGMRISELCSLILIFMMVLYLFMGKVLKNVVFKLETMMFLKFYANIKKNLLLK